MRIEGRFGLWYDNIRVNGKRLTPKRSQEVYNHSPSGFAWGYGGSGPAQLALAILLEAGIPDMEALALHQDFKWEFIAPLDEADFDVEIDVEAWARDDRR